MPTVWVHMQHKGWSAFSLCSHASRLLLLILFSWPSHLASSCSCVMILWLLALIQIDYRYNKLAELRDNKVHLAKDNSMNSLSEDMVCKAFCCQIHAIWLLALRILQFFFFGYYILTCWPNSCYLVAVNRVAYIYWLPETSSWNSKCNFDLCPTTESWGIIFSVNNDSRWIHFFP